MIADRDNFVEPLALLPEELWAVILAQIQETPDLLTCYNTFPLWNSLIDYLHKSPTTWMFDAVFPFLYHYLPRNDILHCRLVCRRWTGAIETFLEECQHTYLGSQNYRSIQVNFRAVGKLQQLSYFQILTHFQENFGSHPRGNPFLSRSLDLIYPRMSPQTLDFFKQFGSYLWTLTIYLFESLQQEEDGGYSPRQFAEYLWQILASVPNLRKLKLCVKTHLSRKLKGEKNSDLREFLSRHPPPALPYLKNLSISVAVPSEKEPLLQLALESAYAPQCTDVGLLQTDSALVTRHKLDNMKRLFFTVTSGQWSHQKQHLASLQHHPLEELHLDLEILQNSSQSSDDKLLRQLLSTLEMLQSSLTTLVINFNGGFPLGAHFPERFNLPQLKKLTLKNIKVGEHTSFEFLQNVNSLSSFTTTFTLIQPRFHVRDHQKNPSGRNVENKSKVDLTLYLLHIFNNTHHKKCLSKWQQLYSSNIWQLVPSLQFLTVGKSSGANLKHVYTRDGYTNFLTNCISK